VRASADFQAGPVVDRQLAATRLRTRELEIGLFGVVGFERDR
jgi:hypothetical protein